MNKKKFVVSEIVILLLGAVFIACGIFYSNITNLFLSSTDPNTLGDTDVDRTFTFRCIDNFITADDNSYVLLYFSDEDNYKSYYVKTPSEINRDFFSRLDSASGTYKGIFKKSDETIRNKTTDYLDSYFTEVSEYVPDFDYLSDTNYQKEVHDSVSDYYIEVVSIDTTTLPVSQPVFYIIGVFLILIFVVRIIAALSKLILFIFAGLILLAVAVVIVFGFNEIRTITSIKEETTGLYSMTFYGDLKSDELLKADIDTTDKLINWIIDNKLYGFPVTVNEDNYGCATFACETPEGDKIFGRNFDYSETDAVVVYINPEHGYASYSLSDLTVLGLGKYAINPMSITGRAYMLATPYLCLDGVNEAGLAAGILELELEELHQDNGKSDLLIYCAIRELLDNCATVDEAINLLGQYDIHTAIGVTYHLHIADKTGKSVVVEWLDGQMVVNNLNIATNSVLTPGEHFDEGTPDNRINILSTKQKNKNGKLTLDEARDLLNEVSQQDFTEWSCIYNLDKFEVTVYVDEDYSNGYKFG